MKLFILRQVKEWEPWYDTAKGFIVRAETEQAARQLIYDYAKDRYCWEDDLVAGREGKEVWLNPELTTCTELDPDGKPELIMRDFHHA